MRRKIAVEERESERNELVMERERRKEVMRGSSALEGKEESVREKRGEARRKGTGQGKRGKVRGVSLWR